MLKVLIADDEIKVCQLIFHLIDWAAIGLEVVGIVNDGKSAYNFICEKSPDIVITDIRMPNYDGIELIRKTKEQFPNIYFIIISGYSHFEYAHNAIKYGVEDYLLKPLKKKELQSTLNKIMEKHNAMMTIVSEKEKLQSLVNHAEEKVRKNLLAEMLMNPDGVELSFNRETICREFHCHFVDGYFTILKIQPFLSAEVINEATLALLLSKLQHMVKEKLEPFCEELITTINENRILCIINTKDSSMTEIKKQLNKMKYDISNLKDIFQEIRVIMGFGGVVDDMKDLFQSMLQADASILNRIAEPGRYIIEYHMNRCSGVTASDLVDLNYRSSLLGCIERFDIEGALEKIQMLKDKLEAYSFDGKLIYNCYMEVVNIFLFGVKNYNIDFLDADWFKKKYDLYMTMQEVFAGLQRDIYQLFHKHEENKKMADNRPIRIAKQYINENYNTALNLESVSSHIGFNPAYFSFLFKKETGKNFMEYVMEVRIQYAKQFLIQTDDDLAEIAMKVGYMDLKYFSKLFKKFAGLNPSEFRKLYS